MKSIELGPLQGAAEIYVGLLAATILVIATNAGIIGVSRLVYSMGLHRQVPDRLRRLHPKFGTPWIGIVIFGVIACVTLIPGQAAFLGNLYAFGAMLSFTIAHVSIARLRVREPDHPRPYTGPGNIRIGGHRLPVVALLGGLGTGIAFITVTALHLAVALAGLGWLAIGIVTYAIYRRAQGLDLTTSTKVMIPEAAVDKEVEYESVLVVFDERGYVSEAIATAVSLAVRRRRGIHVLVTITVPASAPIDSPLPEQEAVARQTLEQARLQGGSRVTGYFTKVRAGGAGRRVVDEARAMRARAVVMALPPRRTGSSLFGRTLETVLSDRPCRVVIVSPPADLQGGGSAAAATARIT